VTLIGTLKERDGALHVVYETYLDSEPTRRRLWWRVESVASEPYSNRRPEAGDTVTSSANGGHWSARREGQGSKGSVYFPSAKQAEIVESELVPPPKVRAGIETRWYRGHWQKLLKTGWKDV
jgi:hypothetical protein